MPGCMHADIEKRGAKSLYWHWASMYKSNSEPCRCCPITRQFPCMCVKESGDDTALHTHVYHCSDYQMTSKQSMHVGKSQHLMWLPKKMTDKLLIGQVYPLHCLQLWNTNTWSAMKRALYMPLCTGLIYCNTACLYLCLGRLFSSLLYELWCCLVQ